MVQPILAMKDYELDLEVPFKIGGEANFVKAYKTVKQPCSKGFDFVQVSGTCERKK